MDRIGQTSPEVRVYSLMPATSVEDEIRLRERIRTRLGENASLLGSDERFFGDPSESRVHQRGIRRTLRLPSGGRR